MIGLAQNAEYRTNIGFASYFPNTVKVTVALYDSEGNKLGTVQQELKPQGMTQIDKIFEKVTTTPVTNGRAVVTATGEKDHFGTDFYGILTYASVVDNNTGDPTTVLAKIMNK